MFTDRANLEGTELVIKICKYISQINIYRKKFYIIISS